MEENTRPILYGVSDYAQIRKKNAWFVDRTAKLRDLEKVAYTMFLRPRRFGKSLLVSILEAYYDIRYADRFEEFFGGTDIGANPTEEHNTYLVLRFDFSAVSKSISDVESDFNKYACSCCDAFIARYGGMLPEGLAEDVLKEPKAGDKLNAIAIRLKDSGKKLYVLIDEYDNFTNTILAESGLNAYNELCHGDGFFKDFFARLKAATSGTDAAVPRLFITGVSPVTMDDVTSGFNIGTNISLDPQFADMVGFRHDDLRAISDYYAAECGFDAVKAYATAREWFDNYRFGTFDAPPLANTTMVLNYFSYLWRTRQFPQDLVDENLRTDYAKIRHLVTADGRLNGNFHVLENLLAGDSLTEQLVKSFQAKELSSKENFTSILYWFGITTITGAKFGKMQFGVPNETMKELAAKMIPAAYADIHKIDERVYEINNGLCDFADSGDWRGFIGTLAGIVKENFAVRDAVEGEKVVQSTIVSLLRASGGPYFVRHEGEAGDGFFDIALEPQLLRWPDIGHACIIELKYLKKGGRKPSKVELEDIRAEAVEQLDRYSADSALAAKWRLRPMQNAECRMKNEGPKVEKSESLKVEETNKRTNEQTNKRCNDATMQRCNEQTVALHRLVLVFRGGDCILREEV